MDLIERLFHLRRETRHRLDAGMNNTEDYAESFDTVAETEGSFPSATAPTCGLTLVHFVFIEGLPDPAGSVCVDRPIREVFVTGDFNGWDSAYHPLEQRTNGFWETDIALSPGRHEYLFIADGIWRPDPMAESLPNRFGTVNSVVNVPIRSEA